MQASPEKGRHLRRDRRLQARRHRPGAPASADLADHRSQPTPDPQRLLRGRGLPVRGAPVPAALQGPAAAAVHQRLRHRRSHPGRAEQAPRRDERSADAPGDHQLLPGRGHRLPRWPLDGPAKTADRRREGQYDRHRPGERGVRQPHRDVRSPRDRWWADHRDAVGRVAAAAHEFARVGSRSGVEASRADGGREDRSHRDICRRATPEPAAVPAEATTPPATRASSAASEPSWPTTEPPAEVTTSSAASKPKTIAKPKAEPKPPTPPTSPTSSRPATRSSRPSPPGAKRPKPGGGFGIFGQVAEAIAKGLGRRKRSRYCRRPPARWPRKPLRAKPARAEDPRSRSPSIGERMMLSRTSDTDKP